MLPMSSLSGSFVTQSLPFAGGRRVTVYVPQDPVEAVVYAADGGWHTERLAGVLEGAAERSTMIVGVHGLDDDDGRLHEYVEAFGGERFGAFEQFFVDEVRTWVQSELGVALTAERTSVWGASLGGEFALAMGLRHPEAYGVVFCASPGGGFTPASGELPSSTPRTYLIGGRQEEWFLDNAKRWADALTGTGGDVVLEERDGEHGGAFWYDEFPLMVSWAFRH
jgi:enterochelin esterase-like enzyme